ncbi:DUF4349 domain-containing protein [Nocardioides bruguierae]|uniref:DUF4349 domain-containing protein n=1 Tax=Nocardioides bruguierae TaxID=2945102 RepID=A0A9X2D699_9ACTN|nr:DUF4349 domain-containing protein [Nocardioides bruguierae]MCM0620096.1 DUF4349 domain-containing protein [Nocardioides bruguierae]
MTTRTTRLRLAGALCLITLLAPVAACSSSSSDGLTGSDSVGAESFADGGADGAADSSADVAGGSAGGPDTLSRRSVTATGEDTGTGGAIAPQLISTGHVSLQADDVDDAVAGARGVAAALGGTVSDAGTRADSDGTAVQADLTLRVPAASFDEAMEELGSLGVRLDSTASSEDVTTQVVDTAVRVRVQRASIRRIEALLDRATSIRAVVQVESQLTRRQADLTSLLRQQAALADRTSLSTITVDVRRTPAEVVRETEEASGFLAGLGRGWDGLVALLTGLATTAGVLLPFAVLLAVLGVPAALVVRRLRRRRGTPPPAAAA